MKSIDVIIRAYVISVRNYEVAFNHNYLKISFENQIYTHNVSEISEDNILEMFEFKAKMPCHFELVLQLREQNLLNNDDLVGETKIDIENRFFSPNFRNLPEIPIETRFLYNPFSKEKKGEIQLFVEIIPVEDDKRIERKWLIDLRPKIEVEVR